MYPVNGNVERSNCQDFKQNRNINLILINKCDCQEKFEDIKGVTRSSKLKDRQHNGQKKKKTTEKIEQRDPTKTDKYVTLHFPSVIISVFFKE